MKRILITAGLVLNYFFAIPINATPFNPFTKVEYDQIRHGMTYEEVKAIMGGEPGERDQGFRENSEQEDARTMYHWINPDGSSITVVFSPENEVINLGSYNLMPPLHTNLSRTEDDRLQNLYQSPITIDYYNQLKIGMTYEEVKTVMGSEGKSDKELYNTSGDSSQTRYHWLNPDNTGISVVFDQDNRVRSIVTHNLNEYVMGGDPIPSQTPEGQTLATRQQYYQLQMGMTYDQVSSIMGTEGKPNPSFNPDGDENFKTSYEWMNPDGSGIKVIFNIDDQVTKIYGLGLGVGLRY
jgi:outer membrane protein assembly factor BamE (lipoprotein component of BamABCDE complex)